MLCQGLTLKGIKCSRRCLNGNMCFQHSKTPQRKLRQRPKEVQLHGLEWEKDILLNIYGVTQQDLANRKYTSEFDLDSSLNKLDKADVSIKTSCSLNTVCMGDCLRVFDAVSKSDPLHMIVVYYKQDDLNNIKCLKSIIQLDLTNSKNLLFGSCTRQDIEKLDKLVKSVPQRRKPTHIEHQAMYALRDQIDNHGAIHFDIKCNSQQSRLQCSFNKFEKFVKENPDRVICRSNTCDFRGKKIAAEIKSGRRSFSSKN